jgi:hypothetical protein
MCGDYGLLDYGLIVRILLGTKKCAGRRKAEPGAGVVISRICAKALAKEEQIIQGMKAQDHDDLAGVRQRKRFTDPYRTLGIPSAYYQPVAVPPASHRGRVTVESFVTATLANYNHHIHDTQGRYPTGQR